MTTSCLDNAWHLVKAVSAFEPQSSNFVTASDLYDSLRKAEYIESFILLSNRNPANCVIARQTFFGELIEQDNLKVFIGLDFSIFSYLDLDLAGFFVSFHRDHLVDGCEIIRGFGGAVFSLNEERVIDVYVLDDWDLAITLTLANAVLEMLETDIRILLE